ncbi:MAG: hypothetical protein ACOX8I_00630 [Bacillota bacterium]
MTVIVIVIISGVLGLLLGIGAGLQRKKRSKTVSAESAPQKGLSFTTVFWIYVALLLAGAAGWFILSYLGADADGRIKLIDDLRKVLILLAVMTAGMFASLLVGHMQAGKKMISIENILLPLTCSFLVFNSIWAGLSDRSIGSIELLAAFESGFGWESFLNRFIKSGSSAAAKSTTTKTGTSKSTGSKSTTTKVSAT